MFLLILLHSGRKYYINYTAGWLLLCWRYVNSQSEISLLKLYTREMENYIHTQNNCKVMLNKAVTLLIITKTWKQPRCYLTREWLSNLIMHTNHGILFSNNRKKIIKTHKNMSESLGNYAGWKTNPQSLNTV